MAELIRELKVVTVTNRPDNHPELAEVSARRLDLVEYSAAEIATYVVDPATGNFWPAAEFFDMNSVTAFLVNPIGLI